MNMTPEQKALLMALLNDAGGSPAPEASMTTNTPEHMDAEQDYAQICAVIEQKLAPAFEMIGQEFKKLNDEVTDLKDIVYKLITSFSDVVSGHRMNGYRTSVLPKYAEDIGLYGPVVKDFFDEDIEQKLLDALMSGEGDPDEIVSGVLGPYKEKFGKYMQVPETTASVSVAVEPAPKGGEKKPDEVGETAEKAAEESKQVELDLEKPEDPVSMMMKKLESVRGPRKTA